MIPKNIVEQIREIVTSAGAEFDGVQDAVFGTPASIIFQATKDFCVFSVPFDPENFDKAKIMVDMGNAIHKFRAEKKQEKRMTLKEKLHSIYKTVDAVEKAGYNKSQSYNYVRAADVTHAIRKQLTELRVYAEINFDFASSPFTIARAKEVNAPFSAVAVKCSVVFHDLDSNEVLTGSGLGTGADTGDKAAYKAQTGALKYALKNAFLVPDEADPEADETVDEKPERSRQVEEAPDFQDARHAEPKVNTTPRGAEQSKPVKPESVAIPRDEPAVPSPAPAAVREPGDEDDGALPTEVELTTYRQQFKKLGDDLSTPEGKLKSSKGLPIERKLLVFLLHITKADNAKNITKSQWDNFFSRVEKAKALEHGLVGLGKLINQVNGVEEKK